MGIWNVSAKVLLVLVLGWLLLLLAAAGLPLVAVKAGLLLLALGKAAVFVWEGYRKIVRAHHENLAYHHYLQFVAVNICVLILSFGVDYFVLFQIAPADLTGMPEGADGPHQAFECLYLSGMNMTNFGYADVTPVSVTAKSLTFLEVALSFVAIIFVLSDFMSLKESLLLRRSGRSE